MKNNNYLHNFLFVYITLIHTKRLILVIYIYFKAYNVVLQCPCPNVFVIFFKRNQTTRIAESISLVSGLKYDPRSVLGVVYPSQPEPNICY